MSGLREIARNDLRHIVEGDACGFRWPIVITSPSGTVTPDPFYGFSNDISAIIDPDTGMAISGSLITAAVVTQSLLDVFSAIPENVVDSTANPWRVSFDDINGRTFNFKVSDVNPDRGLGLTILILEYYDATTN